MSKEKQKHRIKDSLASAPDSSTPTRALAANLKSSLAEHDEATDFHESELLDGTTTHMTADHEIREEQPRVDFEHLTAAEDERPIKRSSRTDQQIAKALLESKMVVIGERCKLHSTPDCSVCFTTELHLQHQQEIKAYYAAHYAKYRVVVTKLAPKNDSPNADVHAVPLLKEADVSRLQEEWGLKESSVERKRKQAVFDTQAQDEVRAKRRVEAGLKTIPNLRREHGYDARKLASLLDHPGFNITILKTDYSLLDTNKTYRRRLAKISNDTSKKSSKALAGLMNSLPLKEVPLFSTEEITSYKAHASRNYTKERGTDFDNTLRLENAIIKRAWELRLLKPQKVECGREDLQSQLDRAHGENTGHDHETAVNQRAAEIGGTIVGAGFYEPSGKALSAKSFERGPMHTKQAHDTDFAGDESGGATSEDSYSEDSGA